MLFKADHCDSGLYGALASKRLTHQDVFPFSFNDPALGQLIAASPAKAVLRDRCVFLSISSPRFVVVYESAVISIKRAFVRVTGKERERH